MFAITDKAKPGEPPSFAFGPFRLLPRRRLLLKSGKPVELGGRALDLLDSLLISFHSISWFARSALTPVCRLIVASSPNPCLKFKKKVSQ